MLIIIKSSQNCAVDFENKLFSMKGRILFHERAYMATLKWCESAIVPSQIRGKQLKIKKKVIQ